MKKIKEKSTNQLLEEILLELKKQNISTGNLAIGGGYGTLTDIPTGKYCVDCGNMLYQHRLHACNKLGIAYC